MKFIESIKNIFAKKNNISKLKVLREKVKKQDYFMGEFIGEAIDVDGVVSNILEIYTKGNISKLKSTFHKGTTITNRLISLRKEISIDIISVDFLQEWESLWQRMEAKAGSDPLESLIQKLRSNRERLNTELVNKIKTTFKL